MKIPKRLLKSKQRKEMWKEASRMLKKLDKQFNFSEIYAVGSFVSDKKRPADIDFTVVTKMEKNNSAWPIDIVIVPKTDDSNYYIKDISKWMKQRYKKGCEPIKLK